MALVQIIAVTCQFTYYGKNRKVTLNYRFEECPNESDRNSFDITYWCKNNSAYFTLKRSCTFQTIQCFVISWFYNKKLELFSIPLFGFKSCAMIFSFFHYYLMSKCMIVLFLQTDTLSLPEVAAALSVLVGSAPPSTFSVASSLKVRLMPSGSFRFPWLSPSADKSKWFPLLSY